MSTTRSDSFADFDLTNDEDGWHAVGHGLTVSVLGGGEKPLCHQRALKKSMRTGETVHHSVLRCHLDGVYVYVTSEGNVVVTRNRMRF